MNMAKSNGKASYGVNKSIATAVPKQPAGIGVQNENGHKKRVKTKGEMKEQLQSDPTSDYHYTRYNFFGELFVQNLPAWRLFTGRLMLSSDPIINFSMNVRNAALMAAEVVVEGKNPEVVQWVKKQWDYLWNYHRVSMVSSKELGFAPLQLVWKEDEKGNLNICGLKEFAPEDCRGLEKGSKLVGLRVKGTPLYFPHGLWLTHDGKYGNPYGNAITRRQYPAWYEKWMERGAKRLQQLRMIKDAYIGDIFWYPPDMLLEIPDGDGGTRKIPWKDVLREIAEARMSGGAMTLPLKLDSNGHELTKYQPPTPIPGATEIFNWVEYCDDNILRGADIPTEVIQAADTGSGFSGRSIPFLVLLSVCNGELSQIVQQTDERGIRPVASLNYGGEPDYTIRLRSLVETFSADISGSSLAGSSIGGPVSTAGQQGVPQAVSQQYAERKFTTHEEVLAHHGYTAGEKAGEQTIYTHPVHKSKIALGSGAEGNSRFWAVHHANGKPGGFEGETGLHSPRQFHKAIKTFHKLLASQHSEETSEQPHEFSCLLFNLPGDLSYEVRQLADQIPTEDLAAEGRELNPHVTIKFGLHTDDPEEVRSAIQAMPPVAVAIGKASIFTGKGEGGKPAYDVVKLEVESDALHKMNAGVSDCLECTDTRPEYKPHVTLAYVKPGLGEYYARRLNALEGKVAIFDRAVFSDKRCQWNFIKLLGTAQFSEDDPTDDDNDDWDDTDDGSDVNIVDQYGEFTKPAHLFQAKNLKGEAGYHYHATNEDNLHAIAGYGGLRTHRPWHGTEQRAWPDGSKERRSYWHHNPEVTKSFAPAEGKPVLLRAKRKSIRKESTGDSYTTKAIRSKHLEYLGEGGQWHPVTHLVSQHSEEGEQRHPFCDWFDEEQFAEGSYLQRLRDFIGRGMEAAKRRTLELGRAVRALNPLESLQSLADTIEEQIRKLGPLLGADLFSDVLPSHAGGTLDVLSRAKPIPTPSEPPSAVGAAIAPQTILEAAKLAVPEPPSAIPVGPELAEILFPPGQVHEPEVHLPAVEAAVEALNQSPVAMGSNYLETAQKVREGSFAITGELTEKAVEDVRNVLSKTIQEGKPQADFIETVAKRLEVEGSPLSPAHIENVFRTNTMSAYSKAQAEAVKNPMVSDAFPYVMYSATRDARVREEHWALESLGLGGTNIYRYDDPTFQKFRPPWSYNCRCRWTPQTVEQAAKKGVKEAMEWLDRAKGIAQAQGGSFYQYLNQTAPVEGQHVEPPEFEPDPAFKRDLVVAS